MISTRRTWLQGTACGFGSLALSAMAGTKLSADTISSSPRYHLTPRVKRIIFLFMQGGVSHVDSFDYKPLLEKRNGEQIAFQDARVLAKTGKRDSAFKVMKSPWKFRSYGESGKKVSDLFPKTAQHVDSLCLIHSMHTEGVAHGPATLFLHCGSTNFVRPSMGSWLLYGLGSENENLPGFISISPSIGNGGPRNYGSAFLPAKYQGTPLGQAGTKDTDLSIKHLLGESRSREQRREQLELLQAINRQQAAFHGHDEQMEAVIESYEMAWKMQSTAPDVLDLSRETASTLELYGIGKQPTDDYGRKCLLARRLCEEGVRFVQVNYGDNSANPAWDQHSNIPKHADHAAAVDQPIAGLLTDLKQRGLLEDTLVWWGGEFGRTPYAQDNGTGRDHNPGGFTVWLAGAGVQAGLSYGETDEFGSEAVHQKVHMHDLHASILHLMGLDHERLTYRYAGRDFRLTDVHGRVIHGLFS